MNQNLTLAEIERLYSPGAGPRDGMPRDVDVLVVGAGPVGLTAANLLGSYGLKTLLVERNSSTSSLPKAIMVDDFYLRLLSQLGLTEALQGHLVGPVGIDFLSPLGFVLKTVPGMATRNGYPNRCAMAQPVFEKILMEGARRYDSVKMQFRATLTGISQDVDGADVEIEDGDEVANVRARFVLACDGAHSFVRKHLAIDFPGSAIDIQQLVLDLAEFPDQSRHMKFRCSPTRPVNSIPAPYGGRRIEFMLHSSESAETALEPATIKRLIEKNTPYADVDLKVIRKAIYTFSKRVASRLRDNHVFLLGDAAHIMPPFGGQGLNTGVKDVANLIWKIRHVHEKRLPPPVLDSYQTERIDLIESTVAFAVRTGRMVNVRNWPNAILRDVMFGLGRIFPPLAALFGTNRYIPEPYYQSGAFLYSETPRSGMVGQAFPNLKLRDWQGREMVFDDVAGDGFTLVGLDVDRLDEDPSKAIGLLFTIGAHTVLLQSSGTITDTERFAIVDPQALRPDTEGQAQYFLIRPDRYVALAGGSEDLPQLCSRYASKLSEAC